MKKFAYILILPILILIFSNTTVHAKELENRCDYEVNNGGATVKVSCNFYDNNSHECWFNNGGTTNNSEKFSNWGSGADFNAKKYYSDNKKCLPYVVFVDTGAAINRYQLYAADSNATAMKIQADRNTFHKDSATIVGSSGVEVKPDDNVLSYTEMLSDIGKTFELDGNCGVKDGKYVVDFNKVGYKLCRDKMQLVMSKIDEWDKYIQEQINKGLLDKNSQVVKDYYAARDKVKDMLPSSINGENNGNTGKDPGDEVTNSSNQNGTIGATAKVIKKVYNIVKIAIPLLIVILSIIDYISVLFVSDEKNYKAAWAKFIKRIIIGIIFFLLPLLISFLIKYSGISVKQEFFSIFL